MKNNLNWIVQLKSEALNDPKQIKQLMNEYLLVIVRGCEFTSESFLDYSGQLGAPLQKDHVDSLLELLPTIENTNRAGTFSSLTRMEWHADRSFEKDYPTFSLLYAVRFGPGAGLTHWANTHLAYQNLPEAVKRRCQDLECRHELSKFSDAYDDTIYKFRSPERQRIAFRMARCSHRVVEHWHGLPYLCLNRGYTTEVENADAALLEELFNYVESPSVTYTHHWETGDLVIANNKVLIHRRDQSVGNDRVAYRVLLV